METPSDAYAMDPDEARTLSAFNVPMPRVHPAKHWTHLNPPDWNVIRYGGLGGVAFNGAVAYTHVTLQTKRIVCR